MYARGSEFHGPPEQLEEGVRYARAAVLPAIRQIPGYRGAIGLVDWENGRAWTLTLWESEAAMRASEDEAAKLLPALVAPSIPAGSDRPLVKVGARVRGNAVYVFAVNAGYTPAEATVHVPGLAGRTLHVLDEDRDVNSGDGGFVDTFDPLAVHVYIAAPPG